MPRNEIPQLFIEDSFAQTTAQIFRLITIEGVTPPLNKLVDSNYNVNFGGETYLRFPLSFSGSTVHSDGTLDKPSITIANVSREIMQLVEDENGLRGRKISVKTVSARFLDELVTHDSEGTWIYTNNPERDSSAFTEDDYLIDSYAANEQVVTFQLESLIDLGAQLPRRRFTTNSCYWTFRDPETCGYTGTETTCGKTLEDCVLRNNQRYFGGFPGVSGSRRVYL
jgi:lambda family phage minor tail protein L